jgi:hypothetical protein
MISFNFAAPEADLKSATVPYLLGLLYDEECPSINSG